MKWIVSSALMVAAISASAGEVTADSNLAIGVNTILSKFERVTAVPAGEVPNVDQSLAIGARSILGIFPRQTQGAPSTVANGDGAKNGFIQSVTERQLNPRQAQSALHATSDSASKLN